ncbi:hypothetical protein BC830DRAFT_1158114, partial [Chytriomyces sp. MP71]
MYTTGFQATAVGEAIIEINRMVSAHPLWDLAVVTNTAVIAQLAHRRRPVHSTRRRPPR